MNDSSVVRRVAIVLMLAASSLVMGALLAPIQVSAQQPDCEQNDCQYSFWTGFQCKFVFGSNEQCWFEGDGRCEDAPCTKID